MYDKNFNEECLATHNILRKNHCCPLLNLDPTLAINAQRWAENLAQRGQMVHSEESVNHVGENVAMKYSIDQKPFSGYEATMEWYSEVESYDYDVENQIELGHFSQVVWKSTVSAGFGRALSNDNYYFAVGQYYPPANFKNRWIENVPRPIKDIQSTLDSRNNTYSIYMQSGIRTHPENTLTPDIRTYFSEINNGPQNPSIYNNFNSNPQPDKLASRTSNYQNENDRIVENYVSTTYKNSNGEYYTVMNNPHTVNHTHEQEMFVPSKNLKVNTGKPTTYSPNVTNSNLSSANWKTNEPVNIDELRNQLLDAHNNYRRKHNSKLLRLNPDLNKVAQNRADKLSAEILWSEETLLYKGHNLGENRLVKMHQANKMTGDNVSDIWYKEGDNFPYGTPDPMEKFLVCKNFSQMLWSNSEEMGVGRAINPQGRGFVIAVYYPEGNIRGYYSENVRQRTS